MPLLRWCSTAAPHVSDSDMADSYLTISAPAAAKFTEKMSRFLAFARKAESADEAKAIAKDFANRYHDARHVC